MELESYKVMELESYEVNKFKSYEVFAQLLTKNPIYWIRLTKILQ